MTFVLFPATTADTDSEFHIYDTETGTRYLIEDLNKTSNAYGLGPTVAALSGDRFVFAAYDRSEPQVYVVDAATGTLGQLPIESTKSSAIPSSMVSTGHEVYVAIDGYLYVTDGTNAGTQLVAGSFSADFPDVDKLWVHNGLVFFTSGTSLYTTDGTVEGTELLGLYDVDLSEGNVVSSGHLMYFYGAEYSDQFTSGDELYVTDGTAAGTYRVADINPGRTDSKIEQLTDASSIQDGLVYFTADDGINGTELWVSDGTSSGTRIVQNFSDSDATGEDSQLELEVFNSQLWLRATFEVNEATRITRTELGRLVDDSIERVSARTDGLGGDLMPTDLTVSEDGQLLFYFGQGTLTGASTTTDEAPFVMSPIGFSQQVLSESQDFALYARDVLAAGEGFFFSQTYVDDGTDSHMGTEYFYYHPDTGTTALGDLNPGSADGALIWNGRAITSTLDGPAVSSKDDSATGTDGNDVIYGLAGNDRLDGAGGDDYLAGMRGADTLIGGAGNDTLLGGSAADDLRDVIYGGDGDDSIDGGHGNDELRGDAGADTITGGYGSDTVIGGDGDDVLTGQTWGDILFGGAGNDFVNGGFGHDRVNGGAGADQFFHIGNAGHGSDWIQDFSHAEGDTLVWGAGAATANDFLVQRAQTLNAGAANVDEVFITHKASGLLAWALVDGDAQTSLMVTAGGATFDLLA